mmetsp:Transcript_7253/g.30122  ORF Transcript_7253/g.30122 Transcript_7253/m.30122 type:complete len:213 (-) Transcript_7253:2728-3366(-)
MKKNSTRAAARLETRGTRTSRPWIIGTRSWTRSTACTPPSRASRRVGSTPPACATPGRRRRFRSSLGRRRMRASLQTARKNEKKTPRFANGSKRRSRSWTCPSKPGAARRRAGPPGSSLGFPLSFTKTTHRVGRPRRWGTTRRRSWRRRWRGLCRARWDARRARRLRRRRRRRNRNRLILSLTTRRTTRRMTRGDERTIRAAARQSTWSPPR